MIVLWTAADIYETVRPGEVRWVELARGEKDIFVMRVEGSHIVYDADGYRIGCACSETLIWTDTYFYEYTEEEREKLYRSAMDTYEKDLMSICEEMKSRL